MRKPLTQPEFRDHQNPVTHEMERTVLDPGQSAFERIREAIDREMVRARVGTAMRQKMLKLILKFCRRSMPFVDSQVEEWDKLIDALPDESLKPA